MKIIDKINRATEENRPFWSFEYFPPKTQQGVLNLYSRFERMGLLNPEFIDVTWGAGGTTSDLTLEICTTAKASYGLETCMHLTCTNMPKKKVDDALKIAKENGIRNILALRGDPPVGQANWSKCDDGFTYAVDLVRYIRQEYGDFFCISVAGYPEGHLDSLNKEDDLGFLKEKIDAGADYIVTQLFYDVDMFISWTKKVREAGIQAPILTGIMPIQSYQGFKRMTTMCKTRVPNGIIEALDPIKDDDAAVKEYGIDLAVSMCRKLLENGVLGFHFYTLNLEKTTQAILEKLEFINAKDLYRPLPWNTSAHKHREKENVRPIFWRNRSQSYVARTQEWDDFPNGRWGDSRSPAYGELDGYGVSIKYPAEKALELWGRPETTQDVFNLFTKYCEGKLSALPWCDQQLQPETITIQTSLIDINRSGYLTINSQPAVNGASSAHAVHGWGPKNGYVYQKAYLEFFCSPAQLDALTNRMQGDDMFSYYAVTRNGSLRTNNPSSGPMAVTWGIFPGKEVVQPTIVEAVSFMAWKDEAFELWSQWSSVYEPTTSPHRLLSEIQNTWYLVNIVHHDFTCPNAIFDIFATREEISR
ncbi:methylenetetrahydrofolate reductase (NAD(P)H) met13 [Entomophthora muscae]|uniref:Methylenetetrahydrofolate reductase (NAD(P)H) met13 n=1 Tax=Entomophthora muscae TaxID=34485 RepID=A0ACC2UJP0_9FUNG|nr:methylenetetrahydrofolate reductase (NAD(P)H) met13 [Entomophthora muscae]